MEEIELDEDMLEHVASARIALGDKLLQEAHYSDALNAFVSALELCQGSPEARWGLEMAHEGLDRQSRSACDARLTALVRTTGLIHLA